MSELEQEILRALLPILPNLTFGEDNEGQLIIYTDMYHIERDLWVTGEQLEA